MGSSKLTFHANVAEELEKQELEAATGVDLANLHMQLLSIYLCNFDLCNAKFLWKRISNEEKLACPTLSQIWQVGQKIWLKEHEAVFTLIRAATWPPLVEPYMSHLEETYRQKSLQLIGKAYLSISSAHFASLTGYTEHPAEAQQLLDKLQHEEGWTSDPALQLITPKRPSPSSVPLVRHEDQLQSLTSFVSFLEN